eukprot:10294002-Alexandrium_andersonii.AAC.1
MATGLRSPTRGPLIAAPEAHSLQDLWGRAGPSSGLAGQAAPAANIRWLGDDATLHPRLAKQVHHARLLPRRRRGRAL